ncbi:MAG: acyl-CoA dehydrogenase family protein [Leptospiraceae bacterium]|nr:acyl-CoA dehydrogenase family protein [Leptospiraceae bacterium]
MQTLSSQSSPNDLFNPTEEHAQLREMVEKFTWQTLEGQAAEHDEKETFNQELFRTLGSELGIFGLTVSPEYGGAGLDPVAEVIVHETMSMADPAFTLSYLAHEVLFVNNLFVSGSEEQKKKYLPGVISGEKIGGMGMTEPGAGTDVLGLQTLATRKSDRYVLNGSKQFITNGYEGDVFIIYAKIEDRSKRQITSFLVESSYPGFRVGKKEEKMGMKASSTAVLHFDDVEVPAENLIGSEDKGTSSMMRNLEIERVTLAAQSLGIARRCIDMMCQYSIRDRKAFGKPLIDLGQIQRLVAESYAKWEAARALVYNVAANMDPTRRNSLGAASAKLVATGMAEEVARNAIQVLGGYGYIREYPVERMLRDAILLSIGGGTNEAMQKNISADLKRMYENLGG